MTYQSYGPGQPLSEVAEVAHAPACIPAQCLPAPAAPPGGALQKWPHVQRMSQQQFSKTDQNEYMEKEIPSQMSY